MVMPRDLCTTNADTCESSREAAVAVTQVMAALRCAWAWKWDSVRRKGAFVVVVVFALVIGWWQY